MSFNSISRATINGDHNSVDQRLNIFDHWEYYDENKDYGTIPFDKDFGEGMRSYVFEIWDIDVVYKEWSLNWLVDYTWNWYHGNPKYIVCREILDITELEELRSFCPCGLCNGTCDTGCKCCKHCLKNDEPLPEPFFIFKARLARDKN